MTRIEYTRDPAGIEGILLAEEMAGVMRLYADHGLATFEAIAPRVTNRYAESGEVVEGLDYYPTPRACAHIFANVPYAFEVEEDHHTLAKVADTLERSAPLLGRSL